MTKALTFAQKVLFSVPNLRLLEVLSSGPKTYLELRADGISTVDNTLYFLDIITKTQEGFFTLTAGGKIVADNLATFLQSVNDMLPGD